MRLLNQSGRCCSVVLGTRITAAWLGASETVLEALDGARERCCSGPPDDCGRGAFGGAPDGPADGTGRTGICTPTGGPEGGGPGLPGIGAPLPAGFPPNGPPLTAPAGPPLPAEGPPE